MQVVGRRGTARHPAERDAECADSAAAGGVAADLHPQAAEDRPGHATTKAKVRLSPILPEKEVGGVHGAVVAISVIVPQSRGGGGGPAVVFAPEEPRQLTSTSSR